MSERNVQGMNDLLDGIMGEVEAAKDALVKRAHSLKEATLDRIHAVDKGLLDNWEKSLGEFDDKWNRQSNNPPSTIETVATEALPAPQPNAAETHGESSQS